MYNGVTVEIGFTGSRLGISYLQRLRLYELLTEHRPIKVHHGLCIGADYTFHEVARDVSFQPIVIGHPPINQSKMADCDCDILREPKPYLVRNRDIVRESDLLIACPHGPMKTQSGTWYTVRTARKMKLPIVIVMPDGTVD